MNRNDFMHVLLEEREKEYQCFTRFQDKLFSIFDITHRILDANNIQYYAAYGTLLGICRDKSMIPWDYDFDIMISIDDAFRVQTVLEKELPENYYVVSNYSDKTFMYFQMRVGEKGFDDRMHLDIFYYFGLPNRPDEIEYIKQRCVKLFYMRIRMLEEFTYVDNWKWRTYYQICHMLYRLRHPFQNVSRIDKKINKLIHKYPVARANIVSALCEAFVPINKSDLGIPQKTEINNHIIYIPSTPEKVLEKCYGQYNKYPSVESTINEFEKGLSVIKDIERRKIPNNT